MASTDSNQEWLERSPQAGETCVFTHGYGGLSTTRSDSLVADWKRDALLFDRVYASCPDATDPPDIPIEISFGISRCDREIRQYDVNMAMMVSQAFGGAPPEELETMQPGISELFDFERRLADSYAEQGVMGEWTYAGRTSYLRRFADGERIAWEGALNNIPIVSATETSWEQIIDFRSDPEASRKYRDLRLWLRSGLNATSVQHATDIIGQKIDDYHWSIRKHGFQTTFGALSQLFEWKQSGLALAAGGVGGLAGGHVGAALASGVVILAKATAFLCERRLARQEVARGPDRAVAILYEAQARFSR